MSLFLFARNTRAHAQVRHVTLQIHTCRNQIMHLHKSALAQVRSCMSIRAQVRSCTCTSLCLVCVGCSLCSGPLVAWRCLADLRGAAASLVPTASSRWCAPPPAAATVVFLLFMWRAHVCCSCLCWVCLACNFLVKSASTHSHTLICINGLTRMLLSVLSTCHASSFLFK